MENDHEDWIPEPKLQYILGRIEDVSFKSEGEITITSREVNGPLAARIKQLTGTRTCTYNPAEFQYQQ